jgi:prepilin-type N-terminal cleavage/methylation domain-containing protein
VNGERKTVALKGEAGVLPGARRSRGRSLFAVHRSPSEGFTLIELLVVMAVIALLMTVALPRYFHSVDRAKEAVLKEDLAQMRRRYLRSTRSSSCDG